MADDLDTSRAGDADAISAGLVTAINGATTRPTLEVGLIGTPTNDSAAAGVVGELKEISVTSGNAITLADGTPVTVMQLDLTAGDWDVQFDGLFLTGATTSITKLFACISLVNNTLSSTPGEFTNVPYAAFVPGVAGISCNTPVHHISVSAAAVSAPVYAVLTQNFTISTLKGYGKLRARRMR